MRRGDRGSGTVLVVGLIGVVAAVLLGALALISAVTASTRARTAADLGALAGAERLVNAGGEPCGLADEVVRRNGARLHWCRVVGENVELRVGVPTGWPGLGDAHARGRAGPGAAVSGEAVPTPSPDPD